MTMSCDHVLFRVLRAFLLHLRFTVSFIPTVPLAHGHMAYNEQTLSSAGFNLPLQFFLSWLSMILNILIITLYEVLPFDIFFLHGQFK